MKKLFLKLSHNIIYKILALFLAFVFWYLIQGEETLEISRKLKITLKPLSQAMLRGKNTYFKDLTLKGPRHLLGQYPKEPLELTLQLPFSEEGLRKIRIDKQLLPDWNPKIRLTVHEPYLKVYLEKKLKL